MNRVYVDLWGWFNHFQSEALRNRDTERQRLPQLYNQGWRLLEKNPAEGLALFTQGRELAERLNEPCWMLFFDHWRCEAYLYYVKDIRAGYDLTVKTFVASQQPEMGHCPVRGRVYRMMVDVYIEMDPVGYESKILETIAYMEQEVPMEADTYALLQARKVRLAALGNRMEEATQLALRYLAVSQETNNAFQQIGAYTMLADFAYGRSHLNQAADYARLAENLARKQGRLRSTALALMIQAVVARRQERGDDALRLFEEANIQTGQSGVRPSSMYFRFTAGYHELSGDPDLALALLDTELQNVLADGSVHAITDCYLRRAWLLKRMGLPVDKEVAAAREAAKGLADPASYLKKLTATLPVKPVRKQNTFGAQLASIMLGLVTLIVAAALVIGLFIDAQLVSSIVALPLVLCLLAFADQMPAWYYRRVGKMDRAIACYDQILSRHSKNPFIYFRRANLHASAGHLTQAVADYTSAVKIRPGYVDAFRKRAAVNAGRGKLDWALLDWDWVIELRPFFPIHYAERGHVYFLKGCLAEALADFQKAEKPGQGDQFAIAGQAVCYQAMGKTNEARETWVRLIKRDKRYRNPERLKQKWHCSDRFMDEARNIVFE